MGPRARSKLRNPKNLNTEVTEVGEGFFTIVDTGWAILDWGIYNAMYALVRMGPWARSKLRNPKK